MSEEDIDYQKIAKKLERMTTRNKIDEEKVATYLGQLKDANITIAVLQKTGLGITVNKLRKQMQSESLLSEARRLIKKWKKLLGSAGENGAEEPPEKRPRPEEPWEPAAEAAEAAAGEAADKAGEQQEENGSSSSGHSGAAAAQPQASVTTFPENERLRTDDPVRVKCREMLQQALEHDVVPSGAYDPRYLAAEIETCVFAEIGRLDMKYKNRIRSRVMNLRDSKNPNLRECVLHGDIRPATFAKMSAEEMASDEMKKLRQRLTKEAIDDHQMATNSGTTTDMFKCGKCKKNNCTYNQLQTRSADEPMTTFVLCNECGHRWKFN